MHSLRDYKDARKVFTIVMFALILAITGCGSSRTSHATTHPNVLNIAYAENWLSLDPAVAYSAEPDVLAQIYQTLTSYTPGHGATAKPYLATSWSSSAGGRVWEFHLRSGVRFQDGEPFNSTAVKISLNRLIKLGKGAAYVFKPITKIATPNATTVVFHLSEPRPLDLMMAAGYGAYIMSPKTASHSSKWFQAGRGYGTGPYKWKSYKAGESAVLTRFGGYWGGWHSGQVSTVVYNFTPDASTRIADLESGTDQMADSPPLPDIPSLQHKSSVAVHDLNIMGGNYLLLNTIAAPLNNALVRRAVLDTFPTREIVDAVYNGTCKLNPSLIPVGIQGHSTGAAAPAHNLAEAKKLLTRSGHPNGGFTISFLYIESIYPEQAQIAQLWKPALAAVGIKLKARAISTNVAGAIFYSPKNSAGPAAAVGFFPPNYPSASEYLGLFDYALTQDGLPFYSNPQVTNLINQGLASAAINPQGGNTDYQRAENLILSAAPGMSLCDKAFPIVSSSRVTGFTVRSATYSIYSLRMH